jgi:hypothetical protein
MADRNFDIIAKEQFNFLQTDYKFNLQICKKEDWGYELLYLNATTAVKITYEYRSAYIFIMIYQLKDGKFFENPRSINLKTMFNGFGLDDIVSIQNSKALIKPAYEYGEKSIYYDSNNGLTKYTSAFAKNLKTYGKKLLKGDFTIFSDVEKIVKKRIVDGQINGL